MPCPLLYVYTTPGTAPGTVNTQKVFTACILAKPGEALRSVSLLERSITLISQFPGAK